MPDQTTDPDTRGRSAPHGGRMWRLWTTEPKLLVGIGALLVGVAAILALFIHNAQQGNTPPTPATTKAPSPPTTAPPTTTQPARVTITYPPKYPPQGTRQERCVTVHGTADLPKGQQLWLVVQAEPDTPHTDRTYYLQGGGRAINGGQEDFHGNWSEDDVFLGARDSAVDDGETFTIFAVITTGDASNNFQDLMDANATRIGSQLPEDTRTVDGVQVVRKKPSSDNCPK